MGILNGRIKPLLAGVILVFIAAGFFPLAVSQTATSTSTAPSPATAISVASVPPRLPASGLTYPAIVVSLVDASKNPSLAIAPVTVYLTSSEVNVGNVSTSVVIPAGKGYVIANFTTTLNPGVTTITASAPGLAAAQTVLNTKTPSGFATHLKIVAAPASVLASGSGALVVQLEDATGAPARASSNLVVTISSSDTSLVKPADSSVTIPAGGDLAIVNFTTEYDLGTAIVTASASTLLAGQTTVQVVGPNPFALSVAAQPDQVVTGGSGRVVIWIIGTVGHPTLDPNNTVITLTSSNTTVVQLSQTVVTLRSGELSVTANYTAEAAVGSSAITASAQGLQSGFAVVSTFKPLMRPAGLKLFFAPNPVLADNSQYKAVVVGIVNATGYPDVATSTVNVNLTSASTSLGTVTDTVTIAKGSEFATAYFTSTYLVGNTILTASAQNLVSGQISAATYGPIPVSVVVSSTSGGLPANGGKYDGLEVSLVDATGSPAVAPTNIAVELASSLPTVVKVNPVVELKAGESSVVTQVSTGISAGVANITASSTGYAASFALVSAIVPAPTDLGLYVSPASEINSTSGSEALVAVQLQDINGLPAEAYQSTAVTIASSNATVLAKPITLDIAPGGDYAWTLISTSGAGKANLTASSEGLVSSSALISVVTSPVTVTASTPATILPENVQATITVTVNALGVVIPNATVTWITTAGTLSPTSGNTSAKGTASTTLTSSSSGGSTTVTAEVNSPITGLVNATVTVVFVPPPAPVKPSLSSELHPYILPIIVIVIAAVAVVLFFFLRRRRRMKAAAEGEQSIEEQPYDELEEGPSTDEGTDAGVMFFGGSALPSPGGLT